jgi:hypothetical protein
MHPTHRIVPFALLFAAAACSATTTATQTDGGADSGASGKSAFCTQLGGMMSKCGASAACLVDFPCAKEEATLSAAEVAAWQACADKLTCNSASPESNACMFQKLTSVPPTAAQAKLATDFCAACAAGAGTTAANGVSCAGNEITLPQGYGRILATGVLTLSDTLAGQAGACVAPAKAAYPSDYNNCENDFLNCAAKLQADAAPQPTSCK